MPMNIKRIITKIKFKNFIVTIKMIAMIVTMKAMIVLYSRVNRAKVRGRQHILRFHVDH